MIIAPAFLLAFSGPYTISIAVGLFTWMYLCVAWNLIGGIVGQVSFGHAAFFGIGGYVSTYLATSYGISPWAGMFVGGAIDAMAAAAVGYLPFRWNLSPLVFALLTLAFAYVLEFGVGGIGALGGTNGLYAKTIGASFWDFRFAEPGAFLVVIAAMLCVLLLVVSVIYTGRSGFFWRAVHDNQAAASAMGLNPFSIKQRAFVLSAFSNGLGWQLSGPIRRLYRSGFDVRYRNHHFHPALHGDRRCRYVDRTVARSGLAVPNWRIDPGVSARPQRRRAPSHALWRGVMAVILLWPGGIVAGLARFGVSRGRLRLPKPVAARQQSPLP